MNYQEFLQTKRKTIVESGRFGVFTSSGVSKSFYKVYSKAAMNKAFTEQITPTPKG